MHEKVLLIKELITIKKEKNAEIFELKNGQNIFIEQMNSEVLHYQNKLKKIDVDNSNFNKDMTVKFKLELDVEKEKTRLFVHEFKKRQINYESFLSDEKGKKENSYQDDSHSHVDRTENCSITILSNSIRDTERIDAKTKKPVDVNDPHGSSFSKPNDNSLRDDSSPELIPDLIQIVGDTKLELAVQKNENEKLQLLYKELEAYTCTLKLQLALQESEKDDIKAMKNHINKILQNSMR
jgi:hypothetical protein